MATLEKNHNFIGEISSNSKRRPLRNECLPCCLKTLIEIYNPTEALAQQPNAA